MLGAFKLGQKKGMYDLWGYVIMPEHVHVIVYPYPEIKVSSILTTIKQSVSKKALNWLKANNRDYLEKLSDVQPNGKKFYRFWQRGGGHDRNMRSVEDIHEKLNYIHNNPVKRGLVERPEQWEWSSYNDWYSIDGKDVVIDKGTFPVLCK